MPSGFEGGRMDTVMVYMTAGSGEEARRIASAIVSERLAACANIFEGVRSFYWWEGRIQDEAEVVIIAKTRKDLLLKLTEKVRSIHSYSCPCIVAVPILGGHAPFLEWIRQETQEPGS